MERRSFLVAVAALLFGRPRQSLDNFTFNPTGTWTMADYRGHRYRSLRTIARVHFSESMRVYNPFPGMKLRVIEPRKLMEAKNARPVPGTSEGEV